MAVEVLNTHSDVPKDNFVRGLVNAEIPEFGKPIKGKTADIWVLYGNRGFDGFDYRVIVRTDRHSAFNEIICSTPDKGRVSNMQSVWWFNQTRSSGLVKNHLLSNPDPNVIITKDFKKRLPVEVVVRGLNAKSQSPTSFYYQYEILGKRTIYGENYPDGIKAYDEFPDGPIITPTTKTDDDQPLTDDEAKYLVNRSLGDGVWEEAKNITLDLYDYARETALERGLIIADSKFEFALDKDNELILIDEILSGDTTRYWVAENFYDRINNGLAPENLDKELLRDLVAKLRLAGLGNIPKIDPAEIDRISNAYKKTYTMLTGNNIDSIPQSNMETIRKRTIQSFASL